MRNALTIFLFILAGCTTTTSVPRTTPAPAPSPAQQQRGANGLSPVASSPRSIEEPRIRVGLESDQTSATFARVPGGYAVVADGGAHVIQRGFTIGSPVQESSLRWAVQVASLSDQQSAETFAQKIRTETGEPVTLLFNAGGGSYRVIVGSVETEDAARPLRERLTTAGYGKDMLIVRKPADAQFRKAVKLTDDEGDVHTLDTASVLVVPLSAETIAIAGQPYRGAARVFVNDRGLLNVINELNLEDYVRGVVPNEMGPRIFDELEALKVQALAARTYAVRRSGDFAREGYDICPTPACQVYKGFSTEDPMSDQAVKETAGLVIVHQGKPIDALYTSTCGGETSDVEVMFPGRNDPYLRRARCVELELIEIRGRADSATLTEMQVYASALSAAASLPSGRSWAGRDVARSVEAASSIGGPGVASVPPPASSRRRDVLTYLARAWNLEEAAKRLTLPEDRSYFFPRQESESPPYLAAAFLVKYGIQPSQYLDARNLDEAMPREELNALLYSWLREHEALLETTGKILRMNGRTLTLKAAGKTTDFRMPEGIPVYRRLGDRYMERLTSPVLVGDRAVVIHRQHGTPVALIVQANFDGASFDRTSSFANWTRSFRADDLAESISKRNPIRALRDIRIVDTDLSKRVKELEVAADDRTFTLKGLPIRWSLNLPDNLFVFSKAKDTDGMDRYTFFGKGWGHGTGMCQVGAYGMAFAGHKAEEIVRTYYTGVDIVPLASVR